MAKYLFLILLVVALFWWLKRSQSKAPPPVSPPPAPEPMQPCAHCGVHLPQSEAIAADGVYYCCEQHRRLARRDS